MLEVLLMSYACHLHMALMDVNETGRGLKADRDEASVRMEKEVTCGRHVVQDILIL